MPAQFRIAETAADHIGQCVVLALGMTAHIIGLRRGGLREQCVQLCPQQWIGDQLPDAHPVRALAPAPLEAALARPVLLGVLAVGVEVYGQPIGHLLQLIGPHGPGMLRQARSASSTSTGPT